MRFIKTWTIAGLAALMISICCQKESTEPDPGPPFTITLNNQNTDYNCVALTIRLYYARTFYKCGLGSQLTDFLLNDTTYNWSVNLFDDHMGDGIMFQEGEILMDREKTCRVTNDSVYWE
jgi:hypothetical protein